jgi:hypothetical protein
MKEEALFYSEMPVIFNGLHDVISQKIKVFITTSLRTSNRTTDMLLGLYFEIVCVTVLTCTECVCILYEI